MTDVVDRAFSELGVTTLVWESVAGDIDSWRIAWENGFSFGGVTRRTQSQNGTTVDGWHATLLSTDTREPKTRWLPTARLACDRRLHRGTEPVRFPHPRRQVG